jgi:hypothetical protein
MNDRIKELMKQAGTDSSGKWMSVDHAEKFAELIVRECCEVLSKEDIRHGGYGYNQHALYQQLRDHFGVGK